jgi:HTH-type transcriptional regulator/antitoxin HipB
MLLTSSNLVMLAHHLTVERKRQGLSRAQAAAVCNVSSSFIRDAETEPARCSLGRLLQYVTGLGLSVEVAGWSHSAVDDSQEQGHP